MAALPAGREIRERTPGMRRPKKTAARPWRSNQRYAFWTSSTVSSNQWPVVVPCAYPSPQETSAAAPLNPRRESPKAAQGHDEFGGNGREEVFDEGEQGQTDVAQIVDEVGDEGGHERASSEPSRLAKEANRRQISPGTQDRGRLSPNLNVV